MSRISFVKLIPKYFILVDTIRNWGGSGGGGVSHVACKILVPWLGIDPVPPAVEVQSPNHWTAREFPGIILLISFFGLLIVCYVEIKLTSMYWSCILWPCPCLLVLIVSNFSFRFHRIFSVWDYVIWEWSQCPSSFPVWMPLACFLFLRGLFLFGGVCLNGSSPRCSMAHSLTPLSLNSNVNFLPRPSWNTLLTLSPSPNPLLLLTLFFLCINISLQHWLFQTLSLSPLKMVLRVPRRNNVPGRRAWVGLSHWGMKEGIESVPLGLSHSCPTLRGWEGKDLYTDIKEAAGGGTQGGSYISMPAWTPQPHSDKASLRQGFYLKLDFTRTENSGTQEMGRLEMGAQWLLQPLTLWRPSSAPGDQENTFPLYTGLRNRISLHPFPCLELVPELGQGLGGGDSRAQSRRLWVGAMAEKAPSWTSSGPILLCLCSRVDLRPESQALGGFPSPSDRLEEATLFLGGGGGCSPTLGLHFFICTTSVRTPPLGLGTPQEGIDH